MNTKEAIDFLEKQIKKPLDGLPKEIFKFVSRITPLINVDLLIKDEKGRTLLSWRDDKLAGRGWHVPGGIIRFKERFENRIKKVSESEIGTIVKFDSEPIAIKELFAEHNVRGHFISLLFNCSLPSTFIPNNKNLKPNEAGYLKWHDSCPKNLIKYHDIYKKYI